MIPLDEEVYDNLDRMPDTKIGKCDPDPCWGEGFLLILLWFSVPALLGLLSLLL